jgi:23S rRNA (cytidine2498-2'-O)-methyltransferase
MMESCRIMEGLSESLVPGGLIVMTLKLPKANWYKKTKSALSYLENKYRIKGARQLFHNRSEVTVLGVREV